MIRGNIGSRHTVSSNAGRVILKQPHPLWLTYRKAKSKIREFLRRWDLELMVLSGVIGVAAFLKSFGYLA